MQLKDIENPRQEFIKLSHRFHLLNQRFIAIAMDYKYYINDAFSENEIFILRDNVIHKLSNAKFHFQLLLEYHDRVEWELKEMYKEHPEIIFTQKIELISFQINALKEAYSIFDSMIYHLCSIFDYLFRLINFIHGQTIVNNPKWNLFKNDKNIKLNIYCSKEMIEKMEIFDQNFIYPLIKHRSHLIHTASDIGEFESSLNLDGIKSNVKFTCTDLFKKNFPDIEKENENKKITLKYSALWLIDKAITNTTEILFELSEDIKRNKKQSSGSMFYLDKNNMKQSPSIIYWGDRSKN